MGWLREEGGVYGVEPGRFRELPWIRALFYAPGAVAWLSGRTPLPEALRTTVHGR